MSTVNEVEANPFDGYYAIQTICGVIRANSKTKEVIFEIPAELKRPEDVIKDNVLSLFVLVSSEAGRLIEEVNTADFAQSLAQHIDLAEVVKRLASSAGFRDVHASLEARGVVRHPHGIITGVCGTIKFEVVFH